MSASAEIAVRSDALLPYVASATFLSCDTKNDWGVCDLRHWRVSAAMAAALIGTFLSNPAAYAASGAGLEVSSVEILAGRLRVVGTTKTAGFRIQIDGTKLSTKSDRKGQFIIDEAWRPEDCNLTLKTKLGVLNLMVTGCGPKGDAGLRGPKGKVGAQGEPGPQGPEGPQGVEGPVGATGPQGPEGPMGPQGPEGEPGAKGITVRGAWDPTAEYAVDDVVERDGSAYIAVRANTEVDPTTSRSNWALLVARGETGEQGEPGPVGPQGPPGAQGPIGLTGSQGIPGPQGDVGPIGPQGPVGQTGSIGPQGPQGERGKSFDEDLIVREKYCTPTEGWEIRDYNQDSPDQPSYTIRWECRVQCELSWSGEGDNFQASGYIGRKFQLFRMNSDGSPPIEYIESSELMPFIEQTGPSSVRYTRFGIATTRAPTPESASLPDSFQFVRLYCQTPPDKWRPEPIFTRLFGE